CNSRMSLRFGSGWLVIYFLICSCTFICSAHPLRARDYTTFNPFEPLPFSVTPDTRFWVTFSPLQGRAALTVEVTRSRGRPASRCCVRAFQNSQRLEMCGAPRSGQRGWSTCTPSRVHIPDVLSATLTATCKAAENDCLERRNSIRPCVPSHVAYKAERGGNELFWSPWKNVSTLARAAPKPRGNGVSASIRWRRV